MADVGRCGRRKQRNPQRKNADVEGNGIKEVSPDHNENSTMCQNGEVEGCYDNQTPPNELEIDDRVEEDSQNNQTPEPTEEKEAVGRPDVPKHPVLVAEEENIKELLNRTDTAVIFPEPPSDQEDAGSDIPEEDDHDKELVDGIYMFKCPHCDKGFTRLYLLRDHLHAVHADMIHKFICPKCSASFVLKSQLDKHVAFHSPTCQSCNICRKTFANVYRLQRHMISHNESSDLRKFKCAECGKAFKFKHHLKEHVRIHSGEKPFECQNCGKRFSHSGSFSSHMTSKKCFVMSAKKPVEKSMDSDISRELATSYASTFPDYAAQYIPFSTAAQISASVAHLNGVRPPFLPYLPFTVANAMLSNLPAMHSFAKHSPLSMLDKLDRRADHRKSSAFDSRISPVPTKNESPTTEVKKVLEIVDATVSQQQKLSDEKNKVALSKLGSPLSAEHSSVKTEDSSSPGPDSVEIKEEKLPIDSLKTENGHEERMYCRFCYENFKSPVELHQHERYLCKKSTEVPHKGSSESTEQKSECSTRASTPLSTDEDDDNEKEQNGRCRSRSLFNEEQLAILKTYFQSNPRPRKIELLTLANQVGYPKRVVQVWFQNMRARDRRHGKNLLYFSNMAAQQVGQPVDQGAGMNGLNQTSMGKQGAYIPVVPQPYVQQSIPQGVVYYAAPQQFGHGGMPGASFPQQVPEQSQPLDLSKKSTSPMPMDVRENHHALNLSHRPTSRLHEHLQQEAKRFQDSAIFKYMQQEGILIRSNTSSPQIHNESTPPRQFNGQNGCHVSESKLIDAKFHENNPLHHGSYTSSPAPSGGDSDSMDNESTEKMRRQRKKSWRQMESEEVELEFVDSPLTSDDQPMKKKRKSWKHHKVDIDEGMYACDQCDKMFSKQSSLARHKYEHSGARPFNCDICGKAFKHKHHLTEHRRLHSGEKPFECKKCGKRFSHSGSYSQHMNHRYKYCKPMKAALEAGDDLMDSE